MYFQLQKFISEPQNRDFQSKYDLLLTSESVIFGHFGVKKVVFLTFLKLFWRCLGSVMALFSVLKGQLLRVFSAPKVPNWPRNWDYQSKFDPLLTSERVIFGNFWGKQSRFVDFFRVVPEVFGHCFESSKVHIWMDIQHETLIHEFEIWDFRPFFFLFILAILRGHF